MTIPTTPFTKLLISFKWVLRVPTDGAIEQVALKSLALPRLLYLQLPQGLFSCLLKYTGWKRATPLSRIEYAFQFLDPSSLLMLPMKILRRLELAVCLGKTL